MLPSVASAIDGPWTDEENDLIVADYFALVPDDISSPRMRR